jgi:hypothetical protein
MHWTLQTQGPEGPLYVNVVEERLYKVAEVCAAIYLTPSIISVSSRALWGPKAPMRRRATKREPI